MFFAKTLLKQAALRALRLAEKARAPVLVNGHRIFGIEGVHGIEPTARLHVTGENSHLTLGSGAWLGERVEIEAVAPGQIEIGEGATLQNDCVVRGDVEIGANCIFARGCLVISTTHRFRDNPEWLISDQDAAFLEKNRTSTAPIRIGEDCWFGACSAVMPGVTIGRGAVIGANTVVTRDIAPYEIHGGAPNRKIGFRLAFAPPARIEACSDRHIPYFYSGFRLKQKALSRSRQAGVVAAGRQVSMVLSRADKPIVIQGRLLQSRAVQLNARVNGRDWQVHSLAQEHFTISVTGDGEERTPVPEFLRNYSVVDLYTDTPTDDPTYGIVEVECG
jgi:acetyltransferase-like isoleucine patch superfamily enzyme